VEVTPRRRRIGLLGGTFDPIHVGHLALARWAREGLGLDEVRLLPTGEPWQKGADPGKRGAALEMARLAIGDEPRLLGRRSRGAPTGPELHDRHADRTARRTRSEGRPGVAARQR
jgi:cytidyltransferase-like protein